MKKIDILIKELKRINQLTQYPKEMKPIECDIEGIGFFHGAKSLFENQEDIFENPIMVVGQDFGTYAQYELAKKQKGESLNAPTWRNLLNYFEEANIDYKNCFYTNAILGVRSEGSAVGKSPAYKYAEFILIGAEFLKFQINELRPKGIIVLGKYNWPVFSSISKDLIALDKVKTFKELDEKNMNIFESISFEGVEGYKTNLTILTHPSYSVRNNKTRFYNKRIGRSAEIELVNFHSS